jgi:hypothetical protein
MAPRLGGQRVVLNAACSLPIGWQWLAVVDTRQLHSFWSR